MIKNFVQILDIQTAIILIFSLVSTHLCLRFNIVFEMPTGLIGIAIVFPIVFSINAAYRRREEALAFLASFKASAVSLYYAHRDWVPGENQTHVERITKLIIAIFQAIRKDFTAQEEQETDFQQIYALFSRFSESNEELRSAGMDTAEVSRAHTFLRLMVSDFENMRNILLYRTPISLRAYTQVFLNAFPILFGPYFAYLSSQYAVYCGYMVAVFYCVVLSCLDNIQDFLENPYDGIGVDDIDLDLAEDYGRLLHKQGHVKI
ncbi:MAG: hypothetical protein HN580_14925 [Deltaproteobacteria bacterium]|jgi:predicted membrane chloride channel (bestrophin family)|nr:hypothetical protein [Deltaproteobacteria bacterium]MBT4262965.1 hypothetical protein [Deltaproteobacteria bacterium]MBT4644548.1 hypothetical protein [Deltaproteobacteria bacterium]MBT6501441.1 hypothetical protein [Deltaproteobacteria bacterium]MBT6616091.1 hypothetical protein [Deltaproteobacteria bacterium]